MISESAVVACLVLSVMEPRAEPYEASNDKVTLPLHSARQYVEFQHQEFEDILRKLYKVKTKV